MDYKDIYEDFYNKTYLNREQEIKIELIRAKSESRAFIPSLNKIIKNTEVLVKHNDIYSNNILVKLEKVFTENLIEYDENSIELSIKNDLYPEYLNLNEDVLPLNYSFPKLIGDLGTLNALNEVNRLFRNNSRLFEMMFGLNDFKDFEIKEYQMVLDNTPIFKKLHKRLYPETKSDKKATKLEVPISDIDPRFTLLNNDEKILLLHIIHNTFFKNNKIDNHPKIDLTDFARVIYLTKDCVESNIFDKNYASKTFYKRLNEGIIYSDSLDKRNKLISSLLEKIDALNLKSIYDHIDSIKTSTIRNNKK